MISINLISHRQKTELRRKQLSLAGKKSAMMLFIFAAFIYMAMIAANFYLYQQLDLINQQQSGTLSLNRQINKNIKTSNSQIDALQALEKNSPVWSRLLAPLLASLPPAVSISEIRLDRQSAGLEISGLAQTREELEKFKAGLEQSGYLDNVYLPIDSLLNKTNNVFTINATIKMADFSL